MVIWHQRTSLSQVGFSQSIHWFVYLFFQFQKKHVLLRYLESELFSRIWAKLSPNEGHSFSFLYLLCLLLGGKKKKKKASLHLYLERVNSPKYLFIYSEYPVIVDFLSHSSHADALGLFKYYSYSCYLI